MAHLTHHGKTGYVAGNDHYDDVNVKTLDSEKNSQDGGFATEFTHAEQRAIIHRIDRRLVLTCGFMYCISLMDRTNLSAAVVAGYGDRCEDRSLVLTKFTVWRRS